MSHAYVIIGIHGLANKPPENVLKDGWRRAIVEGLRKNENNTAGQVALDLVYWANWGYPRPLSEEENDEPYRPAAEGPLPRYRENFWDELRADAQGWIDAPLDWAKRFFGMDALAGAVLEAKLRDLARYYNEPSKRDLLRGQLEEKLLAHPDKRIMLIAHSMGSIVAYDVLRLLGRKKPQFSVDHFVTIGSPLGLPHVKYRIYEENDLVRTPSVVRRWTNLAERRDPVSADTHLSDDYEPNDRDVKVVDDLVINTYRSPADKPNYHKSYGYLRTPELSKLIRSFI